MASPYSTAAHDYFNAGWYPIPLPHNAKDPVPVGFTGQDGEFVSERQVLEWSKPKARFDTKKVNFPVGNVALRLPKTVIGIDVDAYGTKKGDETLAAAEEDWGALPPTWVSTSRTDGISGIRLFAVPEGLAWPGELPQGKGVEILQWAHRYAVVAPSTNPDNNGLPYRWFQEEETDEGVVLAPREDEFPAVDEIPALPQEWIDGLSGGKKFSTRVVDETMGIRELQAWLDRRPDPDTPCTVMRATVTKYSRLIRQASDDGGAHDAGRDGAWAVLGDAKAGHCGVIRGLTELRNIFLAAVRERRADEGAAKSEWARIVQRGAQKVTADDNEEIDEDPCGSNKALRTKTAGGGRLGSADINWRLDDVGNAERLIRVMDDRARWVEEHGSWVLWDGQRWQLDTSRQVERWAVKAINAIDEELAFLEGEASEEVIKAFKAHRKSSSTAGKLAAMVNVAKGRKGIIVPAERFDSNPRLLACANGVLELRKEGVEFRGFHPEQYITLNTGVDYKPEARSPMWEDFLDRFQPDEEVRDWLQRIVGYSLLGYNPQRFIVALVGLTSTGKTTFAEAIRTLLGQYGGPMLASVLRDNVDDKPRPDLIDVLPKRIIIAEELSAAQHLHADQIKRLTGGSLVAARGMRSNTYVKRRPAFTPYIVANNTPTIEAADAALKRRLLVVPFDVTISQDEEVIDYTEVMLATEAEGILAWAVEGYRKWLQAPNLAALPAGALDAALKFNAEMSEFHGFIADACDLGEEYAELPARLYEAYEVWCDRNGVKGRDRLSGTVFGKRMGSLGLVRTQRKVDGKSTWFRVGVRLTDTYKEVVS